MAQLVPAISPNRVLSCLRRPLNIATDFLSSSDAFMNRSWHRLLAVTATLSFGCSSSKQAEPEPILSCDDAEPAPTTVPTFQIGKPGGSTWVPLNSGDSLPVISGGQGGRHVDTSVRFFYVTDERVRIFARVTDPTGDLIGESAETFRTCAGKWTEKRDFRIFMYQTDPTARIIVNANLPVGAEPTLALDDMDLTQ
jgi:hypothetical protein